MFAAGAADCHHQLVFAFFNIIWNQKSQQICQLVQKNPRLREAHDIILNAPVVAGQIFQFIYIKRIRQETDIKYQIRICRDSMLEAKRKNIDHQTAVLFIFYKNPIQLLFQLPGQQLGRVNHIVCILLNLLQDFPFFFNSVFDSRIFC